MWKTNILKESCQKILFHRKPKITHLLDKIKFSVLLCLETYDWSCADRSHLTDISVACTGIS